jgi:major cell surface glycoprotein (TIGR04216 family)
MPTQIPNSRLLFLCIVISITVAGTATGTALAVDGTGSDAPARSDLAQVTPNDRIVFAPTVFGDVAGQVATEDGEVTVRGTASGVDDVLVVMIDRRGRIASEIVTVDESDVFDEEVSLVTPGGTTLSEGAIAAAVFSPGRDGVVGDGEIDGFTRADLDALDENTRQKARQRIANRTVARTQRQVLELFYEESVNDSGSDDRVLADAFTFTDGRTSIETVVPASEANRTGITPVRVGDPMVVRGLTNRKPDDTTISVEVVEGPSPEAFDVGATDDWATDGGWSVELETAGVEPGTYVVEADDGDDTDRVEVRVLPRPGNETATAGDVTTTTRNESSSSGATTTTVETG